MPRLISSIAIIVGLVALGSAGALAEEPEFRSFSGSMNTLLDCPTRANQFPPINLAFFTEGFQEDDGSENTVRCTVKARDGSAGRKGVKVALEGEIVPLDDVGDTIVALPTRSGRTDRSGNLEIEFPLDDLPDDDLAVVIAGKLSTRKKIDSAEVTCTSSNRQPCQRGPETLCLLDDGRFKVEVDWNSSFGSGTGKVLQSGFDSGSFYFINPSSTDLLVQLLQRCSVNDHYWVFYAATTSVEFEVRVTDTVTGSSRSYDVPFGQPAQPVTDTSAFATCP